MRNVSRLDSEVICPYHKFTKLHHWYDYICRFLRSTVTMYLKIKNFTYGLLYFLLEAFGGGGVRDRLRLWPRDMVGGFGAGSRDPFRVLERLLWNHPAIYRQLPLKPGKNTICKIERAKRERWLILVPHDRTWWIIKINNKSIAINTQPI